MNSLNSIRNELKTAGSHFITEISSSAHNPKKTLSLIISQKKLSTASVADFSFMLRVFYLYVPVSTEFKQPTLALIFSFFTFI